jgi:hypothetical protein
MLLKMAVHINQFFSEEVAMATNKQFQPRSVMLSQADVTRLSDLALKQGCKQSEVIRDAIRWYLDNAEKTEHDARESEVAQSIRYATAQHVKVIQEGVERICKMMARQGIALGTLYELTWLSLPDDEVARATFEEAIGYAKQKMRRLVQKDEEVIAAAMKKVVEGQ